MFKFSTFPGATRALRELSSRIDDISSNVQTITRTQQIITGTGSPNSVVTATGPAFYIDATNPSVPILWLKSTAGTSATDWILSPAGSTPDYRLGSVIPGVEFFAAGAPRVLSTLVDASIALNQDIGSGDFTWWIRLAVPGSLSGNAGVASLGPSNTYCLASADNAVALLQQNGDIQLVFGNTTNNTRYGLGLSGRTGQIVDITVTRSGNSLSVYIDGALVTVSGTNTGAGALPGTTLNTNFAITGGAHSSGSTNAFSGIVFRNSAANRALTAADVQSLVRYGIDISDQWGTKTAFISPTLQNGGFETAGVAPNAFAFIWQQFVSGTSGSVTRDTVEFSPNFGSTASARLQSVVSGDVAAVNTSTTAPLLAGKRYRIQVDHKRSSNGNLSWQTVNNITLVTFALTTSWQTYTSEFLMPVAEGIKITASGGGNVSVWADNVIINRIGFFFDLDFSGIYGFQASDRSTNELDGILIGACVPTLPGSRSGLARWTCGANGGTQLFGQACIPTDAMIRTILVENIDVAGTPTVSIGNVSGGSQIVSNVTIGAAGTIVQITPSVLFSTTGNLWASWSAAGDIRITVIYDRI
ncbi:MAG: hypothetical protein EBR82_57835 [Caulobacteraceae bacterium]|nr:hypothetical protein [Caulobacteraceae bacterium]